MGTVQTESLPVELQRVLEPLMEQVVSLTARIKEMDRKVEQIAREDVGAAETMGLKLAARRERA
jgi:hypothetical protein